jgi:DNA-dependent protein kinase catalytic subunit
VVSTTAGIEIPGQYPSNPSGPPNPLEHTTIASFDPTLLVMGSLRRPKRLTMIGSDQKEVPFLVKGGEDLRLDQRVQQLFQVVNQILISHPQCKKRQLQLQTYQVVPMSTKVGMIQWITNTRPLKEIIEEEYAKWFASTTKSAPEITSILKIPAAVLRDSFLKSFASKAKRKGQSDLYYATFEHATRLQVENQTQQEHSTFPGDLLKRAIQTLSSSPENFLAVRNKFAKSLAVFNISSYILGIGDRHLENFLLNLEDGNLVGIDFGHAFGTATQFLPIPELIPFRLTRQLTEFLQPLDADGLLKHNMIHTMSALRENQDILLNTMDVFIKDPLLDWEKLARRLAKEQGAEDTIKSWFPKKKIDIVRRKLRGDNPSHITFAELRESVHDGQTYLKSLQKIVLGDASVNKRATIKESCPSVRDQIECLIDQATDPNILGRTYFGWAPWV